MTPVGNGHRRDPPSFRAILARILCFAGALVFTASPLCALGQDRIASIHSSILALDSARQTALHDLESVSSTTAEAADYRDFIVYLSTRIVAYCTELAEQGGASALAGLTCPAGQMVTGTGVAAATTAEEIFYTTGSGTADTRTQAEKTAALDGNFLATLGNFDEMLLQEEGKVAARVPSQRESSSAGQAGAAASNGASRGSGKTGSGEPGEADERGTTTAGDERANGDTGAQGDRSGAASGAQRGVGAGDSDQASAAYGVPGGQLPPPKDDDIVARQLREAAEKEPDPELQKKLWEEYWKYKGRKTQGE